MPMERRGWVIVVEHGPTGLNREEPEVQRKAAAFARWHEPDDARVSRPDVCPGKASVFSRRQTCRGKSQAPRSSDSKVAGIRQRADTPAGAQLCGISACDFRQGSTSFARQRIRRTKLLTGFFHQLLALEILDECI